mgnify:FL=1
MNVLITGGNGYLGGRLVKFLSEFKDINIFVCSTKRFRENFKIKRFIKFETFENLNFSDLTYQIDILVHLAGMDYRNCIKNPKKAHEVNVNFTRNILKAAIKNKVKKFIFTSTFHVYGENLNSEISENLQTNPKGIYALTKSLAEEEIISISECEDIQIIILRLSNVFGPPTDKSVNCWSLVFNDLGLQAIKTGKIILNSSGQQFRNFLPITEFCRAIKYLIKDYKWFKGLKIFNLGGQKDLRILDVANFIKNRSQLYRSDIQIIYKNEINQNEINKFYFNINHFLETGFQFKVKYNDEIDNLLKFISTNFK